MNFNTWFDENLSDYASDIANHGADAGYPHITYYSDTSPIYDRFENQIFEALSDDAESMGYENIDAMTSQFGRADMLDFPEGRKCLLVWYMCERRARELDDQEAA